MPVPTFLIGNLQRDSRGGNPSGGRSRNPVSQNAGLRRRNGTDHA